MDDKPVLRPVATPANLCELYGRWLDTAVALLAIEAGQGMDMIERQDPLQRHGGSAVGMAGCAMRQMFIKRRGVPVRQDLPVEMTCGTVTKCRMLCSVVVGDSSASDPKLFLASIPFTFRMAAIHNRQQKEWKNQQRRERLEDNPFMMRDIQNQNPGCRFGSERPHDPFNEARKDK